MVDRFIGGLLDPSLSRAFEDLRSLADGDLTPEEITLRALRLARSPALTDLVALSERGAASEDEADREKDDLTLPAFAPPDLADLAARARARTLSEITRATWLTWRGEHASGPLVLIADGGRADERHAAFTTVVSELQQQAANVDLIVTRDDPYLRPLGTNGNAEQMRGRIAILDGDLAPSLVEQIRDSRRLGYLILTPANNLPTLGVALEPDLVLGLPAARNLAKRALSAESPEGLLAALDLTPSENDLVPDLPAGEALISLLWAFARGRSHKETIQVFRRLALGPRQREARLALQRLGDQFIQGLPLEHPVEAIAWAVLYRDVGLAGTARILLEGALHHFPDNARLRHLLATVDVAEGQLNLAIARLDQFINTAGVSLPHIVHTLARAHRRTGQLAPARTALERGLAAAPDNLYLLIEAGLVWSAGGDTAGAERFLRRAHLVAPACGAVLNAWARIAAGDGRPERASRLLERAVTQEPWNQRHRLEQAQLAKERGLLNKAEELLKPLLVSAVIIERQRAVFMLVDTLIEAARYTDAGQLLQEEQVRFDTTRDASRDDRARLASLQAKLALALRQVDAARRFTRAVPNHPYLMAQTVQIALATTGGFALAAVTLDQLERSPTATVDPATARVAAALRAQYWIKQGDWARARTTLVTAIDHAPHHPILLNALGDLERQFALTISAENSLHATSFARAEALYRTALDLDPYNAYTHRCLARLLRDQRPREARRHERYLAFVGLAATTTLTGEEE